MRPRRALRRGGPVQVAHPVPARAVQPGATAASACTGTAAAASPRSPAAPSRRPSRAGAAEGKDRAGGDPGVELLLGRRDRRLRAVARQHPGRPRAGSAGARRSRSAARRSRGTRRRAGPGRSASRACPVNTTPSSSQYRHTEPAVWPGRVHDLERARRRPRRCRRPPSRCPGRRPGWASRHSSRSLRVQRHRRLVPLGHLDGRGDVVGVAVRADDREHLAVAHRVEHGRGIAARIDDDDLLVVADNPDVDLVGPRAAVRRRGRRELIDASSHPGAGFGAMPAVG